SVLLDWQKASSAFPAVGIGLWQAGVREHAAGELVRHLVERGGKEVVRGDERKDGRSRVGRAIHIADVDLVERSFANAEHELTLFLEADVGGALDQVRSNAIGNAGERTDAARQHDHRL